MKTRFAIFLLLFLAVSQVHALSTAVKVDLLTHKITAALNAKDYVQAAELFKEYDALDVAMPPALLLQRARVYFHEKDYLKTLNTLEKYLEDAERGSAEYNQALAMYADVEGKPELQQIRQVQEAQEQARQTQEALRNAARKERDNNLCSGENYKHCYLALDNPRGCYIFKNYHSESWEYEWQGACAHGFAHGDGTLRAALEGSWGVKDWRWWEATGSVDVHGLPQGHWKGVSKYGNRWEFSYVNGKLHGTYTSHKTNGKTGYSCYRNGNKVDDDNPC